MCNTILRFNIIYLALVLVISCFFASKEVVATERGEPQWQETTAQIELIRNSIDDLKLENTLIGVLVRESEQSLEQLLEKDKKYLLSFSITYKAPGELNTEHAAKERTIIQYGLYRTLAPKIQLYLNKKSNNRVQIRFVSSNPVVIQFYLDKQAIEAPVLLTSTIDEGWKNKVN